MLKRFLCIIAVVLVANGAALAVVARNARGAPDAVLTLTEREMRVTNLGSDTTGMTLAFEWDRDRSVAWVVVADRPVLPWFDRAKLTSIGFDCSMDPNAPGAVEYYSGPGLTPRTTYLVFEYDANAGAQAEPQGARGVEPQQPGSAPAPAGQAPEDNTYAPRLRPVDAGNDPHGLRARYADRHRYLLTAGVVRLRVIRAGGHQPARLEGLILEVLPSQVYVPQALQQTIVRALGERGNRDYPGHLLKQAPRYEVTVEYGRSLLPRVVGARMLAGAAGPR